MMKEEFLEEKIRAALQKDESNSEIDYGPLIKAKQKLKEESSCRETGPIRFRRKGRMRVSLVFSLLAFMLLGGALGVSAERFMITDKTDYPFVDDPRVLGKWESVDYVTYTNEFVPGQKQFEGELYLKAYAFAPKGKMFTANNTGNRALAEIEKTWTKGLILDSNQQTASKYEIAEVDGNTYMFIEWKSGDYSLRGMEPRFYVLKQVDSKDYSNYICERRVDSIDYPFADDPDVLGEWESVDFVRTIEMFKPNKQNWLGSEFMTGMKFERNGGFTYRFATGKSFSKGMRWTKGLVLDKWDQTASAYTIKEIDGTTYLFYEWKSGDYTMRGMDPQYYVLKKK